MPKGIAFIGSGSDHGGSIVYSPSQSLYVDGQAVAVEGALHSCPIEDHGTTGITPTTSTIKHNGLRIIREGDVAGCGAVITSVNKNVGVGD